MAEKVEYELNLKDNFSSPLNQAKEAASGFHESVMHIVEALGLIEAAHEASDFIKESLGEFEHYQTALASLTQMYHNNADAASGNLEQLKELAETEQKLTGIHTEDTLAAEQNLLKYHEIRVSYEELIPVIGDYAKATGTDASEAANTLGRALENPERGMRLLMQAGVSPQQIQTIENLQKLGHVTQAQQEIFDILKQKYSGVAEAMYQANPVDQISIQMKELHEQVGQVEDSLLRRLMPAMMEAFGFIRSSIDWLREHKEAVEEVIKVVGILTAGYVVYRTVLISIEMWEKLTALAMGIKNTVMELSLGYSMALAEGYGTLEAAQWALNVAMDANPIGLIIAAVTALIAAIYVLIKAYNEANAIITGENQRSEGFKTETASVHALADSYVKLGMSCREAMSKAIDFEKNTLFEEFQRIQKLLDDTTDTDKRMALQRQIVNISGELSALADKKALVSSYESQAVGKKLPDNAVPVKSDSVKGVSQTTINVTIQKMIGIDKVIGVTKELAIKVGQSTEQMLLAAVNQFQVDTNT